MGSSLLIIFLVVFIDLVGFGIVIPILPYYAQSFGASAWQLGWLMAIYSLMQFVFAPVWGRISDRIGRRPVLLLSIAGTALSMTLLGFASTLRWLFIGRFLAGICGANISTAYAYVTDVTSEKDRAKGMGLVGAAFGLGFIFGPAIGGVLAPYGYGVPMFAGAALALVNWVFAAWKLQEPGLPAEVRASHRSKRFDLSAWKDALSRPETSWSIAVFFLVTFAVTQMEVIFAIYMRALFGYEARQAGVLLALMGVVMVAVQGGMIGRLARRFGESRLVFLGTGICCVALLGFGTTRSLTLAVSTLCVLAFGHGLLHPSLSSLTSRGAAPDRRGAVMGVFQSASSLARVLGPPSAGWFYDRMAPNAPLIGGSIVLALAFLMSGLARARWSASPARS